MKFNADFDREFKFKNERINNSPYVLVSDNKLHSQLVREGLPQDEGF